MRTSIRFLRVALCAVLLGAGFLLSAQVAWAAKLGIMGDSLSDEYAEQSYGAYADNWTEQLVTYRGIDVGPTGAWGEPRRNFYEYNWARFAADSGDLLAQGQHTGLAAQIVPNGINYAVLMIGANDQFFDGNNAYLNIYSNAWSPAQINTWVSGIVNNIDMALNTVLPTGVELVLFNAPDYGVAPIVQANYPSAAGRQLVADVLENQLNPQIEGLAQAYQLPYVDLMGIGQAIYGPHNALNSTLTIGNVTINLQQSDTPTGTLPNAAFTHDQRHPHTVSQGMLANLVLEGLNIGYGANLSLFSEEEVLAHRGLAYGGSDTLEAQIGPYSSYVTNYVPEPSTFVLAAVGIVGLMAFARRRGRCS